MTIQQVTSELVSEAAPDPSVSKAAGKAGLSAGRAALTPSSTGLGKEGGR